jgi:hypothetical protein
MLNKLTIFWFLCAVFLLGSAALYAQDTKPHRTKISWPRVDGAGGYQVEIATSSGEVVFKQDCETNVAYPVIAIGEYKLRIIILDRFKHPATETKWVTLSVVRSEVPEFEGMNPESLMAGKPVSVDIKGDNFTGGCTVVLTNGNEVIRGEQVAVRSGSDLGCRFDLTTAPAGEYDVVIENPEGRKSLKYRKIRITAPPAVVDGKKTGVVISKVRPSSFFIKGKDVGIEIYGEKMEKDSSVALSNGANSFEAKVDSWKDGVLTAVIPAKNLSRGSYDLTVGAGYEKDTLRSAIRMMNEFDGLMGLNRLYLGLGYSGVVVLPSWNSILENSLVGGGLYLGHSLYGLPLFPDIVWLDHFGIEMQGEAHIFTTKKMENRYNGKLYTAPVSGGFYASVFPLNWPVDLLVRGDGGVSVSKLDVKVNGHSKNVISSDPFLSAGVSLRVPFADYFFAEAGAAWTYYMFAQTPLSGAGFFFRAGLRL